MSVRLPTRCGVALLCCLLFAIAALPAGAQAAETSTASRLPSRPAAPRPVQAARAPLDRLVTLDLRGVTLGVALKAIADSGRVALTYSGQVVPLGQRVTVRVTGATVRQALAVALAETDVEARAVGEQIVLARRARPDADRAAAAEPADGTVVGTVSDSATGDRLPRAVVSVKGTELRVFVSQNGSYVLNGVPEGVQVVVVRMLGYSQSEREVVVTAGRPVRTDFLLKHAPSRLQEVVVTATGLQRRMEIPNDIVVIQADSVMRAMPITSTTDLIATRAPGLVATLSSGAPGDPSRLRLRGASSFSRSNDPIIIVDGIRVYSEISNDRGTSLATGAFSGGDISSADGFSSAEAEVPTTSPLDRIDPNSIETIELVKGPSAATLYGGDAANGVIVITTKKGRPGRTSWRFGTTYGTSQVPRAFPDLYVPHGRGDNGERFCTVDDVRRGGCTLDSIARYQLLNDPDLTILGRGNTGNATASVSGGQGSIAYNLTGSFENVVGSLKLPDYEVRRFREERGIDAPGWMRRPHKLQRWAGTASTTMQPRRDMTMSFTAGVARDVQQRSSLEQQINQLLTRYLDPVSGFVFEVGTLNATTALVPEFYRRTTNSTLSTRSGANFSWTPLARLLVSANAGIAIDQRHDETLHPAGFRTLEDSGKVEIGQGMVVSNTFNAQIRYTVPMPLGLEFNVASGFNLASRTIDDLMSQGMGLGNGSNSIATATFTRSRSWSDATTTYGWYVAPNFQYGRLHLSTGLRLDGGSSYGGNVDLTGVLLPKIGASWLVSEEQFFPAALKESGLLSTLRVRSSFGKAGVQPGPADRLRLYKQSSVELDGDDDITVLHELGNTNLRPERSTEIEGGFDMDVLNDRFSITVTGYRKTKDDALLRVSLPPSVGLNGMWLNIGTVRNSGVELQVTTTPLRSDLATWSNTVSLARNRNIVTKLSTESAVAMLLSNGSSRYVEGYPMGGVWERPIVGYSDANGDGYLALEEVVVGDSAMYLGDSDPSVESALHSTLSLFRSRLTIGTTLTYRGDQTQIASAGYGMLRAGLDPAAPLGEQAAYVVTRRNLTDYGYVQTVDVLRFDALAVTYALPPAVTRFVRAGAGSISLQGKNLGLRSNYVGADPQVNASTSGNIISDPGLLPRAREWRMRADFNF